MKFLAAALFCLLFSAGASAQFSDLINSAKEVSADSLSSMLGGQIGADQAQIEGGLGSLFSLASERFSAGDFDKLSAALGKLGMSSEMVSKFLPAALDALGKVGGSDIQGMLQSLLSAN